MSLENWEHDEVFTPRSDFGLGGGSNDFAPPGTRFSLDAPSRGRGRGSTRGGGRSPSPGGWRGRGGASNRGRGRAGRNIAPSQFEDVDEIELPQQPNSGRGGRGSRGRRGRRGRIGPRGSIRQRGSVGGQGGEDEVDQNDDHFAPPPGQKKSVRRSTEKEYTPRYRSGAFAILAQLLLFERGGVQSVSQSDLMAASQCFSETEMRPTPNARDMSGRYGAWAAMRGLIEKKLTEKRKVTPALFSLTEKGRALAAGIVEGYGITPDKRVLQPPVTSAGGAAASSGRSGPAHIVTSYCSSTSTPIRLAGSSPLLAGDVDDSARAGAAGTVGDKLPASPREMAARAAEGRVAKAALAQDPALSSTAAKKDRDPQGVGGGKMTADGPRALGSRRGMQQLELGTKNFLKRQRLYGLGSDAVVDNAAGGGEGGGSILSRALSQWGGDKKRKTCDKEELADREKDWAGSPYDWDALTTTRLAKPTTQGNVIQADSTTGAKSPPFKPVRSPYARPSSGVIKSSSGKVGLTTMATGSIRKQGIPPAQVVQSSNISGSRDGQAIGSKCSSPPRNASIGDTGESSLLNWGMPLGAPVAAAGTVRVRGDDHDTQDAAAPALDPEGVVDISLSDDETDDATPAEGDADIDDFCVPHMDGFCTDGGAASAPREDIVANMAVSQRPTDRSLQGSNTRASGNEVGAPTAVGPYVPLRRAAENGSRTSGSTPASTVKRPPCPIIYRSLTRAAAGLPETYDWSTTPHPGWLRQELEVDAIRSSARMIDAFDLVLVVDANEPAKELMPLVEKHAAKARKKLGRQAPFAGVGSMCGGLDVARFKLMVGDFAWAWRRRSRQAHRSVGCLPEEGTRKSSSPGSDMLVVDCIIERKSAGDLVDSIEGGPRYDGQKRRLQLCGLKRLIYLMEGEGLSSYHKVSSGINKSGTIRTVEANTQLQGFTVKRTRNMDDTAQFLLSLSRQLLSSQGLEKVADFARNTYRPKVSMSEFNRAMDCDNFEPPTVQKLFAECLRSVKGIGTECAIAIAQTYRTPRNFQAALHKCDTEQGEIDLVQNLKVGDGGESSSTSHVRANVCQKLSKLFGGKSTFSGVAAEHRGGGNYVVDDCR